ncbi:OTU domain-containing protein 3-like [Amphiura filiformis]|uniref:OTU domain-containing protein 3-like n=1 Tax=Amphiura filiformis TaxID=82378 RepID=UPI003B21FD82
MTKGRGGSKGKQSKTQRLEAQERKRDERAVKNAYRKKKKDESYLTDDENFAGFATQLQTMGLEIRDIPGDGNCLFRALGDQLEGHCRNHLQHRHDTVQYMKDHQENFEPFVEDDVPFDRHVANLGKSGTYAGNDSIVAFARKNKVNVVIHQLNNPVWKITGSDAAGTIELHISYHNGDHYSSVRKYGDKSGNPTNFKTDNHKKRTDKPFQESSNTASSPVASATNFEDSGFEASGGLCNGGSDYGGMEGLTDMEIEVMQTTGCQDVRLIRDSLEDHFYDVELTVDFILQITAAAGHVRDSVSDAEIQSLSESKPSIDEGTSVGAVGGEGANLWSSEGTGTRIFGPQTDPPQSSAASSSNEKKTEPNRTRDKQNPKQNNRQVKHQKKLEKKQRQMERNRQKVTGELSSPTSTTGDEDSPSDPSTVPLNELGALHI